MVSLENLTLHAPYLELDEEFYDLGEPIPLEEPYLIHFNDEVAKLIGLDTAGSDDSFLLSFLNGGFIPEGNRYFSMCYAGHQFGNYIPRLGDGRAHNLGRVQGWNLQLKGSGETLYAKMADGRSTIKSSIREYLMSEAMHHLGIPTTRALGIIGSQTKIIRNQMEYAGMVLRVSPSWIRFGSFEYFSYMKEHEKLKDLAEYAISESFEHLKDDDDRFYKMFSEVVDKTADLIAKWQGIGFCHGVMNTDNMSIAGLTLDYGPYAMLDDFNYNYVCNHTDKAGRYSYGDQPNVSYWNLTMLAQALRPIIDKDRMQKKLDAFGDAIYPDAYIDHMRQKLGLATAKEDDRELIMELVGMLQDAFVDHTLFFRTLSHYDGDRSDLFDIAMNPIVVDKWLNDYDKRLESELQSIKERHKAMLSTNPKYVLKNYMIDEAIRFADRADFSKVEELMYIARHPYDELPQFEKYAGDTPEHFKNIGLSCSS